MDQKKSKKYPIWRSNVSLSLFTALLFCLFLFPFYLSRFSLPLSIVFPNLTAKGKTTLNCLFLFFSFLNFNFEFCFHFSLSICLFLTSLRLSVCLSAYLQVCLSFLLYKFSFYFSIFLCSNFWFLFLAPKFVTAKKIV